MGDFKNKTYRELYKINHKDKLSFICSEISQQSVYVNAYKQIHIYKQIRKLYKLYNKFFLRGRDLFLRGKG